MANLSDFPVGVRVEATCVISWTLGVFDDSPFIAYPGYLGTIVGQDTRRGLIFIEWDDDVFKYLRKSLVAVSLDGLRTEEHFIRAVGEGKPR